MKSFEEIFKEMKLKELQIPPKRFRSERSELISEIYNIYLQDFKIQTWKNYVAWLKNIKLKHCQVALESFKKSKAYYPKFSSKYFAIRLSHIPTSDLYYVKSIGKDKLNRRDSFNKWLFFSIK